MWKPKWVRKISEFWQMMKLVTEMPFLAKIQQCHEYEFRILYDMMSAVRGPDYYGPCTGNLKELVTGRIRHILFPNDGIAGVSTHHPLTLAELDMIKFIPIQEWKPTLLEVSAYNHCIGHMLDAISWDVVRTHPIWGGLNRELALTLRKFRVDLNQYRIDREQAEVEAQDKEISDGVAPWRT